MRLSLCTPGYPHQLLLLALLFGLPGLTVGQEAGVRASGLTVEVLQRKIEEVEATESLDKGTAGELIEWYRKTLTNLEQARTNQAATATYTEEADNAPAETARLLSALDTRNDIAATGTLELTPATPIAEIERQLDQEKSQLAAAEANLDDLRKRYDYAFARPAIARQRLIEAQQEHNAIADEAKFPPRPDESPAITEARGWYLDSQALALGTEIRLLNADLQSHRPRLELLEAQRDNAAWSVEHVGRRVHALEEILAARRLQQAEQAQRDAAATTDELANEHPALRALAERNAQTSDLLADLARELEAANAESVDVRDAAGRVEEALSSIKSKIAIAGLSQALGYMLIEQRNSLPHLAELRSAVDTLQDRIAQTALQSLQLSDERSALRDIDGYVAAQLADLDPAVAGTLRPQMLDLAEKRRVLVRSTSETAGTYLQILGDLDLDRNRLILGIENYDEFLGKRLLWMRTVAPIDRDVFDGVRDDAARLLSSSNWAGFGRDFSAGLAQSRIAWLVLATIIVFMILIPRMRVALTATAATTWRPRNDQFRHTLKALGLTAAIAAPIPLALVMLGGVISLAPEPAPFSSVIGKTCIVVGIDCLVIALFLALTLDNGVAARHFRWPAEGVDKFRRELRWFIVVLPIARFIAVSGMLFDPPTTAGSLRVLGGLATGIALAVFIVRLLTPAGGVLQSSLAKHPDSLFTRLRPLWTFAASAVLPVLIVLWSIGYTYTSNLIGNHFWQSLWLMGGLVVLHSVALRWLLVVRRRLQFEAALEKREKARAARVADDHSEESEGMMDVEEPAVDFAALDANSRNLLKTAILVAGVVAYWFIWAEAIPALGVFEEVRLWSHTVSVDGVETAIPITLANVVLALIVAVATVAAARGLPSMIEFALLQRMSVTAGGRYTATTLLRYVIFGVGGMTVIGMLGGSWAQVQWLVAALGVGIGFGLQEIVANFISGLIILFERPIRIGDTVTVGDTSGVVTRIRIRATTLVDWDRKELVVPNKEFVTNRLLNWTLSDPITRIVLPVGIAYGSDVANAMMMIKDAAEEHDNVLADPRPFVTFDGFGDNSLNLLLRAYIPSLENRLRTGSDLHEAINRKLTEAGIVIAFPQRDIHFDTAGPLDIRLHRADDEGP